MSSVITRQQALARETTPAKLRHLLARGTWQRVFPGVYVMHTGTVSYRERLEAATLARGDGARVSLECALHLWGLTDREPPIITLAEPAPTHRRRSLPGVRVRRRRRLSAGTRHGIRVTGLPQTILDLAALPGRPTDETVALITRAVAARKVTVEELRNELALHPAHPVRAVVEVDGELHHLRQAAQDRSRDRQAASRGDVVLRVGWFEVLDAPCRVAADVAATLLQRGWRGRPRPCSPGCPVATDARLRSPA